MKVNKLKSVCGTSHFVSYDAALKYYANQGENKSAVDGKLDEKNISIGAPEVKKHQKLLINHKEGRYFIQG